MVGSYVFRTNLKPFCSNRICHFSMLWHSLELVNWRNLHSCASVGTFDKTSSSRLMSSTSISTFTGFASGLGSIGDGGTVGVFVGVVFFFVVIIYEF